VAEKEGKKREKKERKKIETAEERDREQQIVGK
jgi:hypothetical protein